MKIRTGFVSNSSSSSFVLVVKKEDYEKALNESNNFVQQVITRRTEEERKNLFGQDITVLQGTLYGESDILEDYDDVPEEYQEDVSEMNVICEFVRNLSKITSDYLFEEWSS